MLRHLLAYALLGGAAPALPAGAAVLAVSLAQVPPARPHVALGGRRHPGPLATSYTIDDFGTPKNASLQNPDSLNNAGQISGTEFNTQRHAYACVAFTGTHWVVLNPPKFANCAPQAMNEPASQTGPFSVVGYGQQTHGNVAFIASVSGNQAKFTQVTTDAPTRLLGINDAGYAVGTAYRQSGFFEQNPPYVLNGKTFAPLQPQCETFGPFCMSVVSVDAWTGPCPFGGCAITDGNVVFGVDGQNSAQHYEVLTIGKSSSAQNLPMDPMAAPAAGINDALQIAYAKLNGSGNYSAWQYTVGASQPVALGTLPGSTCLNYNPISENNAGDILGDTPNCSGAAYWTWDPVNGMRDLDAEIPTNNYTQITPVGINDSGQILVELLKGNVVHWGLLKPSQPGKPGR
jgi:hypothetical protein